MILQGSYFWGLGPSNATTIQLASIKNFLKAKLRFFDILVIK